MDKKTEELLLRSLYYLIEKARIEAEMNHKYQLKGDMKPINDVIQELKSLSANIKHRLIDIEDNE